MKKSAYHYFEFYAKIAFILQKLFQALSAFPATFNSGE